MLTKIGTRLVAVLPDSVQPYAKAFVPGVATVVAVLGDWAASGALNTDSLRTTIAGLVVTALTFALPNKGEGPGDPDALPNVKSEDLPALDAGDRGLPS
jgi:hypothetical protein